MANETPCNDTYKWISIQHGSATLGDPIGGGINETISWLYDYPGTRVSPAIAMNEFRMRATGRYRTHRDPIIRGTLATLTYSLLTLIGNPINISCASMRAGEASFNMNTQPHEDEQAFEFDAQNTENLAPISVS